MLSRRPREKAAIVKAGSKIFSAILDGQPMAWDEPGEPALKVTEGDDGAANAERVQRPVN